MAPERDASRTPIYQTMFVWEEAGGWVGEGAGLVGLENIVHSEVANDEDVAVAVKVEIALSLTDQDESGKMVGSITFNSDIYDTTSIRRIAQHFTTLAKHFAEVQHMHTNPIPFCHR